MRTTRILPLLVALFAVAACGDDGLSPVDVLRVARAQARWEAQRLTYYSVEARILCFCPVELNRWHVLTVADDSVIAVQRIDAVEGEGAADPRWFATVDEVYRRLRAWNGSMRGNRFEAVFDEATGLPLEVNLITSPNIADGGATYQFRALKPGLVWGPAPP
jgi:hypothetical protein